MTQHHALTLCIAGAYLLSLLAGGGRGPMGLRLLTCRATCGRCFRTCLLGLRLHHGMSNSSFSDAMLCCAGRTPTRCIYSTCCRGAAPAGLGLFQGRSASGRHLSSTTKPTRIHHVPVIAFLSHVSAAYASTHARTPSCVHCQPVSGPACYCSQVCTSAAARSS